MIRAAIPSLPGWRRFLLAAGLLMVAGCQADGEATMEQPSEVVVVDASPAPAAPASAPVATPDSAPDSGITPTPASPPAEPVPEARRAPATPTRGEPEAEPEEQPTPPEPAPKQETPAAPAAGPGAGGNVAAGKALFTKWGCVGCHGPAGSGGLGPALDDEEWVYGDSDDAVFASIHDGRPAGMPAWGSQISEADIRNLIAYIRSLR